MLNKIVSINFDLPTEAQWEFAAMGGVKSNGYLYSGSNNIDDVAWYSANSGGSIHDVKLKLPNELGIYDMTGNVSEFVKDYYYPYPSSSQIDPCVEYSGSGTENMVYRGSNCYTDAQYCVYYRRSYARRTDELSTIGFRLAFNWN